MRIVLQRRPGRRLLALLVCLVAIAVAVTWFRDGGRTTVTAEFTSAEGLNVSDDVKVLGVRVGSVTAIENHGAGVRVTMEVDSDQPIPADARAAIVAPSLVSGRFVQLTPVWTGGPRLADGALIEAGRTAVPLSFDDVKQQLTELATVLGPEGGSRDGALSTYVRALDESLRDGTADDLRTALTELRKAASALSDGRSDLFTTISHLDVFTRNLAVHDGAVRGFTRQLDAVAGTLADNRRTLRGALRDLAEVLDLAGDYFGKNGEKLTGTLADMNLLAAAVADRSNELAGILHLAPHALIDLSNTVEDRAITGRSVASALDDSASLLCGALLGTGATSEECRQALGPLLDLVGVGSLSTPGGTP